MNSLKLWMKRTLKGLKGNYQLIFPEQKKVQGEERCKPIISLYRTIEDPFFCHETKGRQLNRRCLM